jgi:PASTA domain
VKTIIAAIVVAIGALALLTACGSTESATAPVVETVTVTETAEAAEQPQPAAAPAPAPAQGSIEVPNVVGIDHQLAQDTMQAVGLYNLSEEDATGQDRLLIWDRNWTVVSQSPSPGSKVSEDQTIVLRSKKDDE